MKTVEITIVALIVLGALLYLYRTFKPNPNKGGGCGCGTTDCKVPKANIRKSSKDKGPPP
jgi:hypothetical protein